MLYEKASDEKDETSDPISYFIKNGVSKRKLRPSDVSANDEGRFVIKLPFQKFTGPKFLA